jgi:hypothetical protein
MLIACRLTGLSALETYLCAGKSGRNAGPLGETRAAKAKAKTEGRHENQSSQTRRSPSGSLRRRENWTCQRMDQFWIHLFEERPERLVRRRGGKRHAIASGLFGGEANYCSTNLFI